MTLPIPARIADAVAAEINSAVASSAFETLGFTAARRVFDWDNDFKGLDNLTVEVVYVTRQPDGTVELEDYSHLGYVIKIDVVVLKRFSPDDQEPTTGRLKLDAVDPLVRLLEEIQEYFAARRNSLVLSDEAETNWLSGTPHWVDQSLLRQGIFVGATRLAFDFRKEI